MTANETVDAVFSTNDENGKALSNKLLLNLNGGTTEQKPEEDSYRKRTEEYDRFFYLRPKSSASNSNEGVGTYSEKVSTNKKLYNLDFEQLDPLKLLKKQDNRRAM